MAQTRRLIFTICLLLIIVLPFHTFATVWLTSNFDRLYLWSSWKEILVAVITVLSLYILVNDKSTRTKFLSKRYNQVAIGYLLLCGIYLIFQRFSLNSLVGFAIDVRYALVFLAAQLLGSHFSKKNTKAFKVLLVVASVTALLAIIQILILPPNFLTHFGYDPVGINTAGIPPASHQVASGSSIYRAQAALRGPNVLGAYLILPTLLASYLYLKKRSKYYLILAALFVGAILLSYSRSALLGLIGAFGLYGTYSLRNISKSTKFLVLGLLLFSAIAFAGLWENQRFQTVVLHNNPEVTAIQSNQGHLELTRQSVEDISKKPLGYGLGKAGPSSALEDQTQAKISENYFLQVASEIGWLGFGLILALHLLVIQALWRKRDHPYVAPILLAFIALTFTNLLLHTWADEAVAITMWFFAGLVLYLDKE